MVARKDGSDEVLKEKALGELVMLRDKHFDKFSHLSIIWETQLTKMREVTCPPSSDQPFAPTDVAPAELAAVQTASVAAKVADENGEMPVDVLSTEKSQLTQPLLREAATLAFNKPDLGESPQAAPTKEESGAPASAADSFPVENWYIDFEYLILGQKVKKLVSTDSSTKTKDLRFNDFFFAKLILDNQDNKLFLKQDTTKKFIDFQFERVKVFYWSKFLLYVFTFMLPYCFALVEGKYD